MLIRGGANYAFEQVNAELITFASAHFGLPPGSFSIAVCGIRERSEHEDECCVLMELVGEYWSSEGGEGFPKIEVISSTFIKEAKKVVSKGAKVGGVWLTVFYYLYTTVGILPIAKLKTFIAFYFLFFI